MKYIYGEEVMGGRGAKLALILIGLLLGATIGMYWALKTMPLPTPTQVMYINKVGG